SEAKTLGSALASAAASTSTGATSSTRPAQVLAPVRTVPIRVRSNGPIAFVSNRDGNSEIYIMAPDGTAQQRLTNDPASDLFPSWSPDGKQIAFQSYRD